MRKGNSRVTRHIQVSGWKRADAVPARESGLQWTLDECTSLSSSSEIPLTKVQLSPGKSFLKVIPRNLRAWPMGLALSAWLEGLLTLALVLGPSSVLGQHRLALGVSSHEDLLGLIFYHHQDTWLCCLRPWTFRLQTLLRPFLPLGMPSLPSTNKRFPDLDVLFCVAPLLRDTEGGV